MAEQSREPTIALIGRLSRAQSEQMMRRIARRVGINRPLPVPLDEIVVPDTAVALAASGLLRGAAPPVLLAHCHRTYLFGALLGTRDGLKWDPELLFVAAMLHDLGLTELAGGEGPFEQRGASAAQSWLNQQGWPEQRAAAAAKAIRMHLDVGRAGRERPEVALLHFGAAADAIGMRVEDISPQMVAEVIELHPRQGFQRYFADKMRAEARAQPRSTTAAMCRWGQFAWRVEHSPFAD